MGNLILPVAPFRQEELYTRGGIDYKAVFGIKDDGYTFIWIEEIALDATGLTARWVPVEMMTTFSRGNSKPIITYWEKDLYMGDKFIKTVEGSRVVMETNYPDMINFTAHIGLKIIPSMFNGKIRAIDGYNDKPLFDGLGARVADIDYDVNEGPSGGYENMEPNRTV